MASATISVSSVKCACPSCICVVPVDKAIEKNNHLYCSEACANVHAGSSTGCGHRGCDCHK